MAFKMLKKATVPALCFAVGIFGTNLYNSISKKPDLEYRLHGVTLSMKIDDPSQVSRYGPDFFYDVDDRFRDIYLNLQIGSLSEYGKTVTRDIDLASSLLKEYILIKLQDQDVYMNMQKRDDPVPQPSVKKDSKDNEHSPGKTYEQGDDGKKDPKDMRKEKKRVIPCEDNCKYAALTDAQKSPEGLWLKETKDKQYVPVSTIESIL